jgi:hypothetical protein
MPIGVNGTLINFSLTFRAIAANATLAQRISS